jgi:hypothetical protein
MGALNYVGGVLRERWDDTTRTYTAWNASGVQTATRPYTAAENAAADAAAAAAAADAARTATRAAVRLIVTDLQAEKDRMDPIIAKSNAQITAADTKDVARSARRIADAAIELARFVQDQP